MLATASIAHRGRGSSLEREVYWSGRLLRYFSLRGWQGGSEMAARQKKITHHSLVKCHLQVIGTGGGEVPPSLLLSTDAQKYLFNSGEDVQRLAIEHKVKRTKLQNFFITRLNWRNLGGLPCLAMALKSLGTNTLHLYGPKELENFRKSSQAFLGRELIKLETPRSSVLDKSPPPVYSDEIVTITTVELLPQKEENPTESDSDSNEEELWQGPQGSRAKRPKLVTPRLGTVAAFICKLVDIRGKFNTQRALELGLPMGPLCKKLLEGESVTLANGQIIHPSDVVGPEQRGPTFVVLECPHVGFVRSVTTHPKLQYDAFTSTNQSLMLVVHMAPKEVLQNEDYSRWVASFGENTKHLILNETLCPREVALRALTKIQCRLHLMNPLVHHLPVVPEQKTDDGGLSLFPFLPRESVVVGKVLMKYHLKPVCNARVDLSSTLSPMEDEIAERMAEVKCPTSQPPNLDHTTLANRTDGSVHPLEEKNSVDISETTSNVSAAASNHSTLPSLPVSIGQPPTLPVLTPDDALVTFLGTGASNPSKYRNVSGILLQTLSSGNLILDCGEGTLTQLYKCFGDAQGDDIIRNLRTIFISHIHGDHHLGLISILQRRASLLRDADHITAEQSNKTVVVCPWMVGKWLTEYSRMCERVDYQLVNSRELMSCTAPIPQQQTEVSIETVPVIHCKEAYGVVVRHQSGWKVVYSGDTRPCPALAEAGRDATLLIHEATFEDDMKSDAEAKKHCTISEALGVAQEMNPGFTILTHFSQRYPKVSTALLKEEYLTSISRVAMAFDCMSVTLKELHTLPSYLPAMKEIFAEFLDKEDEGGRVSWSW